MDELKKLEHLLQHWIEHNAEHVRTYEDWASRADSMGREELAAVIRTIAGENKKLEALFRKAVELI